RDDVRAFLWLTLAAKAGDAEAAGNLNRLAKELTPEQRAAGKALVESWSPER
ncbi:MAG: sel1 repeat family protein, partial [Proteobacteria bacterium]|nr:sel1 repeat family protein [Pseudomonadota bacterium]